MRSPDTWQELLCIEPDFLQLEQAVQSAEICDYRQIPAQAFAWHAWDLIPEERLFAFIAPFLRQQTGRAQQMMPEIYAQRLAGIEIPALRSLQDWQRVPLLVKDDDLELGMRGFRETVVAAPRLLYPADAGAAAAFGSGGSLGVHTPTFVTLQDRAREIQGWRRGHDYHGILPGDRAFYSYNTTHKGGQWMQESLWAHGVEVHLRRPEESAVQVLESIRSYGINVLFTVQQPYQAMQNQAKSAGINLHNLVAASLEHPHLRGLLVPDGQGRRQIEFTFLGGFEIVSYALELTHEYLADMPVATLLGSSEAIPQACSTHPALTPGGLCHYNHLHLLHSPHYIEIVKPQAGAWVPVVKGEQGLLVYTSWARDGTIWIRYAPGDVATKLLDEGECPCGLYSPVIANVHRKDLSEQESLLLEGCAAG